MNIKMLVGLSGNEYSLGPGDERDFPEKEGIRLIEAGFAIPVAEQQIERAVETPSVGRRGKRGRNVVSAENGDAAGSGAGN